MRFIVDAQLPPALARWLTSRGHDGAHVIDLGLAEAGDAVILDHAIAKGAIVVTKDAVFAHLAGARSGAQVLWLRFGNATSRDLLAALTPAMDEIERALAAGQRLVEVNR
ncbi:MAG: DUF5615 family PIN-like protein [Parvularculaceae bacterium]